VSTTKEHYEDHLADIYAWMSGDLMQRVTSQKEFFEYNGIIPAGNKHAVDLGSGHGIQSLALTELGFLVTAIDFSRKLLYELEQNSKGKVHIIEADLMQFEKYAEKCRGAELVVCMGDTLTHLGSLEEVTDLIFKLSELLNTGGKLVLSFRSLTDELKGAERFINVKSDDKRILTCFLESESDKVTINDIIHEFDGNKWNMKISSYKKLRISNEMITDILKNSGLEVVYNSKLNGMEHIIAQKQV
jgi:hypothetical protein